MRHRCILLAAFAATSFSPSSAQEARSSAPVGQTSEAERKELSLLNAYQREILRRNADAEPFEGYDEKKIDINYTTYKQIMDMSPDELTQRIQAGRSRVASLAANARLKTVATSTTMTIDAAVGRAVVHTTPDQVYADGERNETAAKSKYLGKQVYVAGKLTRASLSSFDGESAAIFSIKSNYFTPVRCYFSQENVDELKALNSGDTVTVTGTGAMMAETTLVLKDCRVKGTSAVAQKVKTNSAPANPPMGSWAVYQTGAAGYAFQHNLTLAAGGRYRTQNGAGTFSYYAASKRLNFSSGPLKGFGGLYYTNGRNADNEPTIALNALGPVKDLSGNSSDVLQFAKFRP